MDGFSTWFVSCPKLLSHLCTTAHARSGAAHLRAATTCYISQQNRAKGGPERARRHAECRTESSVPELGPVAEMLQRFGIGERLEVLHGPAVHHVVHGELDDL